MTEQIYLESRKVIVRKIKNTVILKTLFNVLILACILLITLFHGIQFATDILRFENLVLTLVMWVVLYLSVTYLNDKVKLDTLKRFNTLIHYDEIQKMVDETNKELEKNKEKIA